MPANDHSPRRRFQPSRQESGTGDTFSLSPFSASLIDAPVDSDALVSKAYQLLLTIAVCLAASACGDDRVVSPSAANDYAGQWSGTTTQGRSITLSVSAEQKVTSITVGYNFGGCSGTHTFSDLSLDIGTGPSGLPPRQPSQPSLPGFGFGSGSPEAPNFTQVTGFFTSNQTASGSAAFLNVPDCGNAVANWSAAKR